MSNPWIVTTSLDKHDATTRQLIRRHVMRGKNTRASKRSKKETYAGGVKNIMTTGWTLTTPRKIASELSLVGFQMEVKPYMLGLIHRAFTVIKPSTYKVEDTLLESTNANMLCVFNISHHPAMLHATLFTAQSFYDAMRQEPDSDIARLHLAKTLYHLQACLNDAAAAQDETILLVVLTLATAAVFSGDIETARKHMEGLYQLASLRGGLGILEQQTMIEHKAQRLDFGLALATGGEPRFFPKDNAWSPHIAQDGPSCKLLELGAIRPSVDPRLLNVWADIQAFSRAANQATSASVKMPTEMFARLCSSAPPRLLELCYESASVNELLRLCMLAYMKCVLAQIEGFGKHLKFLAMKLKAALLTQQDICDPEMHGIVLWAGFITAIAVYEDFDRGWIETQVVKTATSLGIKSWKDARATLKRFIWIDILFDKKAEQLFDEWLGI